MRSTLVIPLLALGVAANVYERQYDYGGGYGGGGGGDDNAQSTPAPAPAPAPTPAPAAPSSSSAAPAATNAPSTAQASTAGQKGDTHCVQLMCITAIVNGTTVTYELKSTGSMKMGWMGMGFGTNMPNTPMVVMWPGQNNDVVLSQRMATGYVMPRVDPNPPRIATADPSTTQLTGDQPQMSYTIPIGAKTAVNDVIWAFGVDTPSGTGESATFLQHYDSGTFQLDLSKDLASTPPATPPAGGSGGSIPLKPYQKIIVAHAIVCILGFLLLLPAGALYARLLRTITIKWFLGHWIFQWGLAGPVITVGWILGIVAVAQHGVPHVDDNHKRLGIALGILYAAQCSLGGFIHFIKDPNRKRRPPQNYVHAVLGLTIIGLAFYQVHLGYDKEWPKATSRGKIGNGANIVFYIWVVLLPVLYFGGLALLPRQFRQERQGKQGRGEYDDEDMVSMTANPYRDEPSHSERQRRRT